MITQNSNGIRTITLGENTTQISQVVRKGETESSGICFCNSVENGRPSEDAVIINILNMHGVIAYIRGLAKMLATWELEGVAKDELELLRKSLEEIK